MDPFLGEIRLMAFSYDTSDGWLRCDGRFLLIREYQALYSLLGTRYGGDGTTTFAIPDLRGRVALSADWEDYDLGAKGGLEYVTLTSATIPPHSHAFLAADEPADKASVGKKATRLLASSSGAVFGTADNLVAMNAQTSTFGGSQGHNNMQPSLVLAYCIASRGLYPPRP